MRMRYQRSTSIFLSLILFSIVLGVFMLPLLPAASIKLTVYDGAGQSVTSTSATLSCSASGNPAVTASLTVDDTTCKSQCPNGEGAWYGNGTFSGSYTCNGKTIPGNTPVSAGPVEFNPGPGWDDYCDCTPPNAPSITTDTAWHRSTFSVPVSYQDNNRVYQVLYASGVAGTTITPDTVASCTSTTSSQCDGTVSVVIPTSCYEEGKDACELVVQAKDFWQYASTKSSKTYNVDLSPPVSTHTWDPPVYTDARGKWYNATAGAAYTITCQDTYSGCDYIHVEDRYASCTSATYLKDNVNTQGTAYGGTSTSVSHTITNCNTQQCSRVVCYQSDDNAISTPGNMEPLQQSSKVLLDGLPPSSTILSSIQGGTSGSCGDGICAKPAESATSCPQDCQVNTGTPSTPSWTCGNGVCESGIGETPSSCPSDCGYCGDGLCTGSETSISCRQDCPPTTNTGSSTGSGSGTGSGTGGSVGAIICGNGVCDPGETSSSCPQDCGTSSGSSGGSGGGTIGTPITTQPTTGSTSGGTSSSGSSSGGGACPALYVEENGAVRFAGSLLKGAFLKQLASRDYHHVSDTPSAVNHITISEPVMLGEKSYLSTLRLYLIPTSPGRIGRFTANGSAYTFTPEGDPLTPRETLQRDAFTREETYAVRGGVVEVLTQLDPTIRERVFLNLRKKLISPHAYAFEALIPAERVKRLARPFTLTFLLDGKPLDIPLVERISEGESIYLAIPPGMHELSIIRDVRYYPTLRALLHTDAVPAEARLVKAYTPPSNGWTVTPAENLTLPVPPLENGSLSLYVEGYYHYGEYDLERGVSYVSDREAFATLLRFLSMAGQPQSKLGSIYLGVSDI